MPKTLPPEPEPQSEPSSKNTQAAQARPKSKRTPELEIAFGLRIRAARISVGMSQSDLGAAMGVSFQQVQKYEKGSDRIAASTLQRIADALGVHPGSFYDGSSIPAGSIDKMKAALKAAETLEQIRNPRVVKLLLTLAKVLAEEDLDTENGSGTEHPLSANDGPPPRLRALGDPIGPRSTTRAEQ